MASHLSRSVGLPLAEPTLLTLHLEHSFFFLYIPLGRDNLAANKARYGKYFVYDEFMITPNKLNAVLFTLAITIGGLLFVFVKPVRFCASCSVVWCVCYWLTGCGAVRSSDGWQRSSSLHPVKVPRKSEYLSSLFRCAYTQTFLYPLLRLTPNPSHKSNKLPTHPTVPSKTATSTARTKPRHTSRPGQAQASHLS